MSIAKELLIVVSGDRGMTYLKPSGSTVIGFDTFA